MRSVSGGISIQIGAKVMTADDKELGIVKDVRDDRFQVDVRLAPDYWLGTETVDQTSPGEIKLFITKEAVGSAKLHEAVTGPGLE